MQVAIQVHKKLSSRVDRLRLKRAAARAWNFENQPGAAAPNRRAAPARSAQSKRRLTIYITTDREIRLLNRKFHATNATTDVLSFQSNDPDYLGDIVISFDRARVQARQVQWRLADELNLLVVHGVLHLLGYDDLTPRQRARMWKRQEEILGKPTAL